MNAIVKVEQLTKMFGTQAAVKNVNLEIKKGDIYGLIGRNGAGKTTLIKMITSLTKKTRGKISILGSSNASEFQKALARTASIIESPVAYGNLTAEQNLEYYRVLRGIPNKSAIKKALKLVNLEGTGKKKFKHFSLGMKQRLGIAIAILDNPDFIILDEPINGLDPIAIIEFRELLLTLNKKYGITILISSHILSELYHVANRFGIIHHGKMIREITKKEFDNECKEYLKISVDNASQASVIIKDMCKCDYKIVNEHEIRVFNFNGDVADINIALVNGGIYVHAIQEIGVDLEEFFAKTIQENK